MSKRQHRILDAQAFLMHATNWSETSIIAQVFSRDYGIVTVIAKGAKRPYSVLRPILSAFQPLLLSWSGQGEIKTLTRAEIAGLLPLGGRSLMSGWYMNELLLKLLPKEDPHQVLFDAYADALAQLADGSPATGALRRFEWTLLNETGYAIEGEVPDFDDRSAEPALRLALRERINEHLENRSLLTRKVLHSLRHFS
ncbi:DNA repair protein RecO [Advenella alkanexedens]|jgi:DNA repair protein RecO (recombination protein O)|uniref:DNA repair protein RecO n=1 Tax=Advenella alkanexedens TaxID=1481665 RepID=A0ABS6NJZ2_9BURK|nr:MULTISPECIES: DNA repair protein RecO [Advenella]MBV4395949.1 DNA repair protein RecO [Advenella alkanexedens]MDD3757255.1 DNA repair protein RecO [Advenella sp.]NLN67686.1 DNA repair protein RecO [Alcaligenaceae bacterium]